jgi:serralysin
MNFGWLNAGCSEQELRSAVLHEFGHVLGLVHQYQNLAAAIVWDRDAVMRDLLEPPHYWSLEDIEHTIFRPIEYIGRTALDPQSIMGQLIPASWTTNGLSIDLNSDLSEADKQFIRRLYS